MAPFDRYFWLVAVVVAALNVLFFMREARRDADLHPERAEGYRRILWGYVLWLNFPWVVMGVGSTVGRVPTIWHFFRPRDGNPWVLAFFASVLIVWFVTTYWLFFRGGAQLLAAHPAAVRGVSSPGVIKFFWLVCLGGGIAGAVMMWTANIPLPLR